MAEWFKETLYKQVAQTFEASAVHFRLKTEHQELMIFENPVVGRVLALDGIVQTTEADEFVYHEMLTHVPILAQADARRMLIIGGGDGGMLEEALKHKAIEHVTMVEIDRSVVDLCKRYLPSICGDAFEDPRTELVIADGAEFVAQTDQRYDVIVIDSTDPIGPAESLFRIDFYRNCKRCLRPGGVLVTQNGVPFFQPEELTTTFGRLKPLFADVSFYLASVPTYYGGSMALGWASDDASLRGQAADQIRPRFAKAQIATRYYDPAVHAAAFALPRWLQELLKKA